MNHSKQRTHMITTAALSALVIALATGVVAQRLSSARISGDIGVQKHLLAKSRQELKDRAKFRSDFQDLSLKLGGRMSTCSWSDQMPFMMAQVNSIVEANGLKVESLQPEPMTSSGSIQRFPMRLGVQTDLKHLTDVLKDLKDSVPLIDIERLDVRVAQGDSGKLQANLTVASFVVLDKSAPVPVRRTVKPVKAREEKPREPEKSEPKAEAKQPEKPAAKPQPTPAARPTERRNGEERQRPEKPEPPHLQGQSAPRQGRPAENGAPSNGKATAAPQGEAGGKTGAIEDRPRRDTR